MAPQSDQGRPPVGLIALLSGCNFVIGMGAFVIIGMVPLLASDLDISTAAAGGAMTAYALAYAVLSPLLVSLTGQIGRRRVIAAGMGLFAFAALVWLLLGKDHCNWADQRSFCFHPRIRLLRWLVESES